MDENIQEIPEFHTPVPERTHSVTQNTIVSVRGISINESEGRVIS